MLLEKTSSLSGLSYDLKDHDDLFPYAEAFEEIRKKIEQNFSLRKIGKGNRSNVFEIYRDNNEGLYIIKLPRLEALKLGEAEVKEKVKQEMILQREFILQYESLAKQLHRASMKILSEPITSQLTEIFGQKSLPTIQTSQNLEIIQNKQKILQNIKIPRLLDIYQGRAPIILMEKIQGSTLRFEIIAFLFKPLFSSHYSLGVSGELLPSDKTLYENCKNQNINDKKLSSLLEKVEKNLTLSSEDAKSKYINKDILKVSSNITFNGLILAMEKMFDAHSDIFIWLFGDTKKGHSLQEAYDFFITKFPPHPDPNLHNFIITPDNKLGIIDFG